MTSGWKMTKTYQKIHIVLLMMNDMNKFLWILIRSQRNELQETDAQRVTRYITLVKKKAITGCERTEEREYCVSWETRSEYDQRSKRGPCVFMTTTDVASHSCVFGYRVWGIMFPDMLTGEVRSENQM